MADFLEPPIKTEDGNANISTESDQNHYTQQTTNLNYHHIGGKTLGFDGSQNKASRDIYPPMEKLAKRRSICWEYFIVVDVSKVQCNLCSDFLSYKAHNTSTMLKHLWNKHRIGSGPTTDPNQAKKRSKTVGTSTGVLQVEYTFPETTEPQTQPAVFSNVTIKKEEDGYQCEVSAAEIYEPQDLLGAAFDNADLASRAAPQPIAVLPTEMVVFRRPDPVPHPPPRKEETSLSARIANAELKEAIVKYMSADVIAASWLDGRGFRRFAQTLLNIGATYGKLDVNEIMPDSSSISDRLNQQAKHMRTQALQTIQVENPAQFAVSVDTWRNLNNQQYATVTIHYVTEHFQLRTLRLDTIQAEDETIEVQIRNVLDSYGLGQPKCLVTQHKHRSWYTTSDTSSCAVVLLNQVAGSVFSFDSDYLPAKLFLSCSIILAHAQNSERAIKYRDYLPKSEKRSDWPVKSQFLNSIANVWDILLSISSEVDGLATLLLEVDITQLRCVVAALQPFKDALELLSLQTEPTSHFIVPIVRKLETHLQHCVDDNDDVKQIKSQLFSEFMKVREDIMTKTACCALFFDPSKKSLRIIDEAEREMARETILLEMRLIDSELCLEMPLEKKLKTQFDLEEFSDFDNTFKDPVMAEFERYNQFQISQQGEGLTTSVLNWWKNNRINFPRLAQLANAYLSIPAIATLRTSLDESKTVLSERRKFLEPEFVSDILILNAYNSK